MSNLVLRLLSAIILAPIVIAVAWYGSWPFFLLTVILALCILHEWLQMSKCAESLFARYTSFCALAICLLLVQFYNVGWALFMAFAWAIAVVAFPGKLSNKIWLAAGFIYAAAFGFALMYLRMQVDIGFALLTFVAAIVWSTDIFAYFFGRLFKGPKLAPKISPGKTWSGAVGGLFAGILAGYVTAIAWQDSAYAEIGLIALFFWGASISVFSQLGDLFESWVKRRFDVKDSGNIIPGHGGVMDRVDGLLFALVLAFAALLVGGLNFPIVTAVQQAIS